MSRRTIPSSAVIGRLEGTVCSLVDRAYGDELVLGFGPTRPARAPLKDSGEAEFMLYSRTSHWFLETESGLSATSYQTLSERRTSILRNRLVGKRVFRVGLSEALGVFIKFDDRSRLEIIPGVSSQGGEPPSSAWEMVTPEGAILQALPGEGIRVTENGDVTHLVPLAVFEGLEADVTPPAEYAAGSVARHPARSIRAELLGTLRRITGPAGYRLLPIHAGVKPDALVVTPENRVIAIEIKSTLARPETWRPATAFPTLLVVVDDAEGFEIHQLPMVLVHRWSPSDPDDELASRIDQLAAA